MCDMNSYQKFFAGELKDYAYPREKIAAALASCRSLTSDALFRSWVFQPDTFGHFCSLGLLRDGSRRQGANMPPVDPEGTGRPPFGGGSTTTVPKPPRAYVVSGLFKIV